jgi:hypothetical protein
LEASGWKDWETFSPHPIEGTECRVNVGIISQTALVFGLFGFVAAVAMQVIPTSVLYPISLGGKSTLSLPAFFPIAFESILLFSAIGGVMALLFTARLPRWYRPLFEVEEFRKASRDAYFVAVYCEDPEEAARFLTELGGEHITTIPKEER